MNNYKDLDNITLKMLLLSGKPINVGNLEIKPYKLKEIRKIGYANYMHNIQWITITLDDFINSIEEGSKRETILKYSESLKVFDFYYNLGGNEVLGKALDALKMILRCQDIEVLPNGLIVLDFYKSKILYKDEDGKIHTNNDVLDEFDESELKIVNRDNFEEIVEVVKLQNYLMGSVAKSDNEPNPVDEETRKLIEEMNRFRDKVEKAKKAQSKSDDKNNIDISDMISAVGAKSNSINRFNIWDLSIYELYDEYSRIEMIDNYDFSLRAIIAGAQKVELNHWSSKLQDL